MAAKEVMIWALEVNVNREAKAARKRQAGGEKTCGGRGGERQQRRPRRGLRGLETIPKEELAKAWGAGPRPRPADR